MNNKKLAVIAIDPSSDQIASLLVEKLSKYNYDFILYGDTFLCEQNNIFYKNISKLNRFGTFGFILSIPYGLFLINRIYKNITKYKPQVIIMIDGWGFMYQLAKKLSQLDYKPIIIKYVAPQFWASRPQRIVLLKKYFDFCYSIFPFETKLLISKKVNSLYVGNPLFNDIQLKEAVNNLEIHKDKFLIALVPGSRKSEIKYHLPLFIKVAKKLYDTNNQYKFIIPTNDNNEKLILSIVKNAFIPIRIVKQKDKFNFLKQSYFALVTSGTVATQIAILKTPMIIIYKTDYLSTLVIKKHALVKYANLVNIVAKKEIIPELLFANATKDKIFQLLMAHLSNKKLINKQIKLTDIYLQQIGADIKANNTNKQNNNNKTPPYIYLSEADKHIIKLMG